MIFNNQLMTPKDLEDFLVERNYEESAMREIMSDPHFSIFSGAYINLVIKRRKISINFIRELRAVIKKWDWDRFLIWYKDWYTEEEREQMKREFHVVKKWGYYEEEKQ